jgi:capsular polysaccharide biosynthesis protein
VPASAPAFVPETLRIAGYESRVTPLDDGVYRVGTLHIPTRLAPTADVSPDAIDWLDARFPGSASRGRRIYVSREDAPVRYVSNEAEIRKMLEQEHGFETLAMSTLPLEDQVRAFREASVIVGAHGAAFAHLAFTPRGAAFLELFQDGHFNHCYGRMAAIRGVRYGFLVGERDGLGLRVDRASLESVVNRMVRDAAPAPSALDVATLRLN